MAARWTGGGATPSIDDAGNWGGTLPEFGDGSLVATFPADAVATVPASGTWCFKGIVAEGALSLSGGQLQLGSAGLVTSGAGVAVTVDCPIALAGSSNWTIASGDTVDLTASAVISSIWPECVYTTQTLTQSGAGRLNVRSSNPGLCNVDFSGPIYVYADDALGGPKVWAEAKARTSVNCYGNVFANNFRTDVSSSGTDGVLLHIREGDNVFNGKVSCTSANAVWWHFDNAASGKATVTFNGGYTCTGSNNGTAFSPIHNGTVTVSNTPLDATKMYIGYVGYYWNTLNLNVASNRTTRGIHLTGDGSVLNTNVKDALYATDDGQSGVTLNANCTWNLAADQGVNVFLGAYASAKVNSETGATLHLRDDRPNTVKPGETASIAATYYATLTGSRPQTNKVAFVGNVNFSKEGVLDHFMEGASTSSGSVTVKRGLLDFTTGSWTNATTVTIADGGRLGLTNPNGVFGKDVNFVVEGDSTDGSLVIPSGINVKCATLTVNGTTRRGGVLRDGVVTGGGTLQIGLIGTQIIFW